MHLPALLGLCNRIRPSILCKHIGGSEDIVFEFPQDNPRFLLPSYCAAFFPETPGVNLEA